MRLKWSRRALADLARLQRRFTNKARARWIAARLLEVVAHLEQHPEMGRTGTIAGTRELVVAGTAFVVVYAIRESADEVVALALIDGRTDWK